MLVPVVSHPLVPTRRRHRLRRVSAPPVEQDARAWAATQGAVDGRQTRVQISVQGRSDTAVVLEALHVRIVSRGHPFRTTGITAVPHYWYGTDDAGERAWVLYSA